MSETATMTPVEKLAGEVIEQKEMFNPNTKIEENKLKVKNKHNAAYSKTEDQIIMDIAMQYPDNLAHAFKQIGKKIHRKQSSVSARYYYLTRKDSNKSVVVTGSAAGFSRSKVSQSRNGKLLRKEPLQPLIVIFKQLLDFNPKERKKIIEFLKTIDE